jgi:hypothetical protein
MLLGSVVLADPPAGDKAGFFEAKVRPLLAARCYSCHGPDAQMGGLRLDSADAIKHGNAHGPAVVAGDLQKSLLIRAIGYTGTVKMPPTGKLKPEEIAILTQWVRDGAVWPTAPVAAEAQHAQASGTYQISDAQRKFWSFQPVRKPAVPTIPNSTWAKNPVDRFILAKLNSAGLHPSPPADKRTLLRRVTYDLTGLPPTPAEIDAFLADKSPNAYEKVVDRLLASPRYGERWGRHWLDIARYADTKGYVFTEDALFHDAFEYRDWVIRALNSDMPYDQFLKEQLAADLMQTGDDRSSLAAMGYLSLGRRFLNDPVLIADDRIDVTCRGMMGLTVGCARCHDHKFDPIPQKDYYSLYGVFASTEDARPVISPKPVEAVYTTWHSNMDHVTADMNGLIKQECARLRSEGAKSPVPEPYKGQLQKNPENKEIDADLEKALEPYFSPVAAGQIASDRTQIATLQKSQPLDLEHAIALHETAKPVDPHVFKRGNPGNQGDAVPRQFLEILSGPNRQPFAQGSGRLELANAIADARNPLTARVLVNRLWAAHFGEGIVRTTSDFGLRGERPTHPELLDWLAATFVENGWSLKKLHRLMVLSSVYRQSVGSDAKAEAHDPEDRLLWRQNRRRLDLEELRDSLLFDSGQLENAMYGQSVDILSPPFTHRRTVYGFIDRQNLPGLFRTFDFASPDVSAARRFETTVPQQALYLMNSPFVQEQARAILMRPEVKSQATAAGRVKALYRVIFGRAPSTEELALGTAYLGHADLPGPVPAWQYGYGSYSADHNRVTQFTRLAHYTGSVWQAGDKMPDAVLHYVSLSAIGGHPGDDLNHSVIRRWVAPRDCEVTISGMLEHPSDKGDGVEGRIVSSREGQLGDWVVFHGKSDTPVKRAVVHRGDTIDFVVECRTNPGYDSFAWAPVVTVIRGATARGGHEDITAWSASNDFADSENVQAPVFNLQDRYAQALFMTNEFSFID